MISELERCEPALAKALGCVDPGVALPAEVAARLGIVDRVVPASELLGEGEAVIRELVGARGDEQVRAILRSVDDALELTLEEALDRESDHFLRLARGRFGPARQEGIKPTSPRAPDRLAELAGGGSGWGNFPPAMVVPGSREGGGGPLWLVHDGAMATLALDDPPRNEMNNSFFSLLAQRVAELRQEKAPAGLVVRGAGRHFSSGADLEELGRRLSAEPDRRVRTFLADNIRTFQNLAGLPFPSVAAIGGCCLGSGFELALACDHRLAAENAVLALPEAQYGLMPGCGGTVRLSRLVGRRRALQLIMSGRSIMAPEAFDLGLVDAIHPRKELVAAAEEMALP